jgi:phosphoglucomutase
MITDSTWTRRHDRAILALLGEQTTKEAARRARVGQATLQRWLRDPIFVARLQKERAELFSAAKTQLLAASAEAVSTLSLAARGERVPWTSRVQAARALIGLAVRVEENETILARLERLERGADAPDSEIVQ